MEVEKTIEFILDMQAKFETNLAAHDVHMARIDRRLRASPKFSRSECVRW